MSAYTARVSNTANNIRSVDNQTPGDSGGPAALFNQRTGGSSHYTVQVEVILERDLISGYEHVKFEFIRI